MNKYRNILKESNPSFLSFSFGAFRFFLWHDIVLKNYQSVLPHFFHGRFRDLFFSCGTESSCSRVHGVCARLNIGEMLDTLLLLRGYNESLPHQIRATVKRSSPFLLLWTPFIYRVLTPCFQRKVSGGYKYPSKRFC